MSKKPLGRKAYGSIGHLPNSRMGPSDHHVHEGQARICTEKARDKNDTIIVQEKLDGSCTSVAKINGQIFALGRAGYLAATSPFEQHHLFAQWVYSRVGLFDELLEEGERFVGEWVVQAHGTIYPRAADHPWVVFDLMKGTERATLDELMYRSRGLLFLPHLIHKGGPISVDTAIQKHRAFAYPCDEIEGVVYRVERAGAVDFLAKYVRQDKQDGKYLPGCHGNEGDPVWNVNVEKWACGRASS